MIGYADPELLIAGWLRPLLPDTWKVWRDPRLPTDWPYNAPLVHLQRGQGLGAVPMSLDDVTLDVDVYAKVADHAREAAQLVWSTITLKLPLTTFQPSGVFAKGAWVISPPSWAPDPNVFRRSAAYRVMLHGFVGT